MLSQVRSWLYRTGLLESAVLGTLLLLAVCVWGFIEVADEVREGDSRQFDEKVLAMMRGADGGAVGPSWLVRVAHDLTALGGGTVITLVTASAAGYLMLRGRWGTLCLLLVSTAGGGILSSVMKRAFERPRPDTAFHLAEVSSPSFPSGHSMLAAVMYFTLAALLAKTTSERRIKAYVLTVAGCLVVLIGATRVYLRVHYPTDVLAGWCAGISWALLCSLAARWLQRKGAMERESPFAAAD